MNRTVLAPRVALLWLGLAAIVGCGGKGQLANEGIDVTDGEVKLVRDETRDVTVRGKLTPGETAGNSTFSVANLPTGLTATFDPATVDFSTNFFQNTVMTLTADRTMMTGTYTATVRRTKGDGFAKEDFRVKVVDFAVDVNVDDTSITLGPGESQVIDVTIDRRGNSNGTVEFDLGGDLPNGVDYSFDPPRVLVDFDHTRVHTKLTLAANWNADTSGSEKCYVRALKGNNVDRSDDITVALQVPDAEKPRR